MYLLIDPGQKESLRLALFDKKSVIENTVPFIQRRMLQTIVEFLEKNNREKETIQGIGIVLGVGGFTSTRIAVTLANAWGYVYKIPLLPLRIDHWGKWKELIIEFEQTKFQYISAEYSAPPNIGPRKKKLV